MKKKPLIWLVVVLILGSLSILLSGVFQKVVITPVMKFFWIVKGYYGTIHQAIIWSLIILVVIIIAVNSLRHVDFTLSNFHERSIKLPGDVNQMAFWIRRAKHGPYPRWYIARTLADLAVELLRGQGKNVEGGLQFDKYDLDPSKKIQGYLETAIRSTPATFSRQIESLYTDDDPDPEEIMNYLEKHAENKYD